MKTGTVDLDTIAGIEQIPFIPPISWSEEEQQAFDAAEALIRDDSTIDDNEMEVTEDRENELVSMSKTESIPELDSMNLLLGLPRKNESISEKSTIASEPTSEAGVSGAGASGVSDGTRQKQFKKNMQD